MPLNSIPAAAASYVPDLAADTNLQSEYSRLRAELEHLLAQPEKDLVRVDMLVDQLEKVQLAFKGQHGIKGNNPNE